MLRSVLMLCAMFALSISLSHAQDMSKTEILGKWKVTTVTGEDATEEMKDATFHFKENGAGNALPYGSEESMAMIWKLLEENKKISIDINDDEVIFIIESYDGKKMVLRDDPSQYESTDDSVWDASYTYEKL